MAGPAMIEGGGLGQFKPTDIGPIDVQSKNGCVDLVAEDETHAAELAKQVFSFLTKQSHSSFESPDQALLDTFMPENRRHTFEIRRILETVFDSESVLELQQDYGQAIRLGFARLEGRPVAFAANNCNVLGGAIDVDSGNKMARFMQLCDQFELPFISFCDTPGFMVGPDHEELGAVRQLANLFKAGSQFSRQLIGVVIRKCYGLGAQAMLGGV